MDISGAVSTMVNNLAAQSDPAYRSNQEIMSALATQIKTAATTQTEEAGTRFSISLLNHVNACKLCTAKGTLDDQCKIGMLVYRIGEKTFGLSK